MSGEDIQIFHFSIFLFLLVGSFEVELDVWDVNELQQSESEEEEEDDEEEEEEEGYEIGDSTIHGLTRSRTASKAITPITSSILPHHQPPSISLKGRRIAHRKSIKEIATTANTSTSQLSSTSSSSSQRPQFSNFRGESFNRIGGSSLLSGDTGMLMAVGTQAIMEEEEEGGMGDLLV